MTGTHIMNFDCAAIVGTKFLCKQVVANQYGFYHEEQVRPLYAVIVEKPENPRSIAFHSAIGFSQSGTYLPADGIPRLIFCHPDPLKVAC